MKTKIQLTISKPILSIVKYGDPILRKKVENITDFNEHSKNMSWSVSPNIGYSFTRWVTGNLYMIYGISENNSTGRTEEKDFGFNMNIKISG